MRETLPMADQLTFEQLRDDIPKVLEQVAKALESDQPHPTQELVDISSSHGTTRFHQSFNLNELLVEYQMLRPIVVEEIMQQLRRRPDAAEVVALNAGLDVAARRAAVQFVEHQNKQLVAATEAQSKYLSFLSHDLRGGLNGVFLMIEVIKRELVREPRFAESIEDLDVIRRQIFETVGTMDRFLHAERFRKGKVQVRPGPINLKNLISEISAQFAYQAKDKGIELRSDADGAGDVRSDKELLTLILQNLVANGIKYTSEGEVRLTAGVDGDGWRLGVSDDGPGIDESKLSELFAPFVRGETYGQPGVGLGLSIARQAAEVLGAKLWAESKPGTGSKFYLRLPKECPLPAANPKTDAPAQK